MTIISDSKHNQIFYTMKTKINQEIHALCHFCQFDKNWTRKRPHSFLINGNYVDHITLQFQWMKMIHRENFKNTNIPLVGQGCSLLSMKVLMKFAEYIYMIYICRVIKYGQKRGSIRLSINEMTLTLTFTVVTRWLKSSLRDQKVLGSSPVRTLAASNQNRKKKKSRQWLLHRHMLGNLNVRVTSMARHIYSSIDISHTIHEISSIFIEISNQFCQIYHNL